MMTTRRWLVALGALFLVTGATRAEVNEVRFAQQFSLAFLQFNVMKQQQLLEKHAAALGIPNLKVTFATFNGPDMMNDALLSGNVDIVSGGVPGLITLWAKVWGTPQEVRGVAALSHNIALLTSRNPNVRTIRDFSDADKIALPAVKISFQALILEMAAAKEWGDSQYERLDRLTMTMSPPDATTGLLSGNAGFNAAFTVPPFQDLQLRDPAIHTVLDSSHVTGKGTTSVFWTSKKFHDANPTVFRAILAALKEANEFIAANRREAVSYFVKDSRSPMKLDDIVAVFDDGRNGYDIVPRGTMEFATFMHRVGRTRVAPTSWKDLFFADIHDWPGG
jgi:NitT/TauT family transport system substrate-binding protein